MAAALDHDPQTTSAIPPGPDSSATNGPLAVHPMAVDAANDLLDRLYAHGILDLLRALTTGAGDIISKVAEGADRPDSLRAMSNGLVLLRLFAKLDPNLLQELSRPGDPRSDEREVPGLWSIFKRLRGRDARRGLGAIVGMLERLGASLEPKQS